MSGWVLVGLGVAILVVESALGLWFLRRPPGPNQAQQRMLGLVIILGAIPAAAVLVSLGFGLFGEIEGIEAIDLYGGQG